MVSLIIFLVLLAIFASSVQELSDQIAVVFRVAFLGAPFAIIGFLSGQFVHVSWQWHLAFSILAAVGTGLTLLLGIMLIGGGVGGLVGAVGTKLREITSDLVTGLGCGSLGGWVAHNFFQLDITWSSILGFTYGALIAWLFWRLSDVKMKLDAKRIATEVVAKYSASRSPVKSEILG